MTQVRLLVCLEDKTLCDFEDRSGSNGSPSVKGMSGQIIIIDKMERMICYPSI